MGPGNLTVQRPHDGAAVERTGQLVKLGELLDALVGFLEFEAAVVEHRAQRTAVESHKRTLSDREDVAKDRRKTFEIRRKRHADRRGGDQENRSQPHYREGPGNGRLPGSHPQRTETEDQEQDAEKNVSDFRRRQQEHQLKRDMATDLGEREVRIVEPVADMGFGQHDEKADHSHTQQEINRGNDDRGGAGVAINQQHKRYQRAASSLHDEYVTALPGSAPQYIQR